MKVLFLSDFLPINKLSFDSSFISLLNNSDYIVFNLEGSPLTETSNDKPRQIMPFHLDEIFSFLKKFGKAKFVLALANNHIYDNGVAGFDYLINRLEEEGIKYFGTLDKPYINLESKISILNFVTGETVAKYISKRRLNYLFYNKKKLNNQIKELEKTNDILILYPHWGRDMDKTIFNTYKLNMTDNRWFVFGHHPHVISGIENNYIYSMGNTYIPHPYYYSQYPAVKFGLAINFDTDLNNYEILKTEVSLNKGLASLMEVSVSSFVDLDQEIRMHGDNFSYTKKKFLQFFSFSGGILDWFKLVFLQFLRVVFEVKLRIKKHNNE